jgi:multiple sugar transport system permease protein
MSTTHPPGAAGEKAAESTEGTGAKANGGQRRRRATRRIPVPKLERTWLPYALVAPAILFMTFVHILPMAGGGFLSFKNLNTFTFNQLFGAPWHGWENYRTILFGDTPLNNGFMGAASNTFTYTFWTVTLAMGGGLGLALLLHRHMRGRRVTRALLLVPWIMPTFVVAMLWRNMWQSDIGIVNTILVDWTGLLDDRPLWLIGENSIWAIIVPSIWRGIPLAMLLFAAGLQAIPSELHEAASIDGAGALRRFWHVTLPLLRPLIAVQLLFGVVYTSYQYAMPVIMIDSDPGPHADLLMTLVVRESFDNNFVGVGAAMSTLMMLGMFVWVGLWFVGFRRDLAVQR